MEIVYKPKALEDINILKKSGNKSLQKRISNLISDIENILKPV